MLEVETVTASEAIPVSVVRLPRHVWDSYRRAALKMASRVGLSRKVWDKIRIESGSARHADLLLLLLVHGGRAPEAGMFAAVGRMTTALA